MFIAVFNSGSDDRDNELRDKLLKTLSGSQRELAISTLGGADRVYAICFFNDKDGNPEEFLFAVDQSDANCDILETPVLIVSTHREDMQPISVRLRCQGGPYSVFEAAASISAYIAHGHGYYEPILEREKASI